MSHVDRGELQPWAPLVAAGCVAFTLIYGGGVLGLAALPAGTLLAGPDPRSWYPPENPWRWPASDCEPALLFSALTRLKLALGAADFKTKVHTTFPRQTATPKPAAAPRSIEF